MKKWALILLFLPCLLFANQEFYVGEMKFQSPDEENAEHYGFFLLKRTFCPQQNQFIDSCFFHVKDGEILAFQQIADLSGELQEIISNSSGVIIGLGNIGFPWECTTFKEQVVDHTESPIIIDVQNKHDGETRLSIASVYAMEEDGSKEFFGTFSACFFTIDQKAIEQFFSK